MEFKESDKERLASAWNVRPSLSFSSSRVPCWRRLLWGCNKLRQQDNFVNFVENATFDYFSATFIVLNAVLLGAQADFASRKLRADTPLHFRVSELIFCLVFTAELAVRVAAYGRRFFSMAGWKWNYFDCFLVFMQLFEEAVALVAKFSGESAASSNFGAMRMLRVIRLVRILRLVRIMHLIGELRILVASILGSLRSLLWTLLLLFIIMYIIGVYFCQVVTDHLIEVREDVMGAPELRAYYGSMPKAVTSLYQAITGGVSWRDIVIPLQAHISPWLLLPVCGYIAFALLALLNIITGVFVENAMKSAKKDDDMYILTCSRQLFIECCDEKGEITWDTFQSRLDSPGMQNYFKAVDLSIDEAEFLFTLIDIDESGSLRPDEFVNGCLRLRGNARALDLAILMREVVGVQRHITDVAEAIVWMTEQMDPHRINLDRAAIADKLAASNPLCGEPSSSLPQIPSRPDNKLSMCTYHIPEDEDENDSDDDEEDVHKNSSEAWQNSAGMSSLECLADPSDQFDS